MNEEYNNNPGVSEEKNETAASGAENVQFAQQTETAEQNINSAPATNASSQGAAERPAQQTAMSGHGSQYVPNNGGADPSQPDYRSAAGTTYTPYGTTYSQYAQNQNTHNAQNAQNSGYVGYNHNTAGGGIYYGGSPSYMPPEQKKKKEKKKSGTRAVAWLTALCIVCSALFGVGGVFVGSFLFSNNGIESGGTVNYTTGESVTPKDSDGTVVTAAEIAADSVVEITTEQVSFFYGEYISSGAGSGVIIDSDGYIITCAHVVDGASSITVKLTNGDSHSAEIVGSDSQTDIAVIKIDATGLVAASIGDSDNVVVGETAIAIGNPLGSLGGTVTSGIVSALNREITIDGQKYSLLQTDASINPGNSGGGLFDIDGNLIGIVNAKSSGSSSETTIEGLGFAIPINTAIDIAKQLVENGYVGGRVNLGIYVCEVDESTSMTSLYQNGYANLINYITDYGVYFLEYQAGQNGDLLYGDRIIAIDDVSVSSRSDILSLLEEYEIGDTVTVSVSRLNSDMRRSQVVDVSVTLVEQVPDSSDSSNE